MNRRLTLVGAAALGALVPVLAFPVAAAAEETGSVLISLDGTVFERSPQGGVFPRGTALIPGGSVTGTFYVKNDSGRDADLRISVAGASSANATFIDALSLEATTQASDGTPVPLSSDGACIPLLSGERLPSRQVTAVQITLAMDREAGNHAQGSDADAALVVALTDPAAPDSSGLGCDDDGGIPLLPAPDADHPLPETTDPVPAIDAPQPTASTEPDDTDPDKTGVATPAAETPPTAGALPPTGSLLSIPLLGVVGVVLGAAAFLFTRPRKRPAG